MLTSCMKKEDDKKLFLLWAVLPESGSSVSPCLTHVGEKGDAEQGIGKTATGLVCEWFCISAVKLCPCGPLMAWRPQLGMH